ncbi:MAG: VOC family protein [Pseudomonadota bacterium]
MNGPTNREIFQNAWVVEDVYAAIQKWSSNLGVGPFFVTEYRDVFADVTYRGEPAELNMIVALAQAGPIQVELIQPLTDRCAYRDSVPQGDGFHHMCVWSEDFAADCAYFEQRGFVAANTGRVGAVSFGYFDTRPLMGCMMEIVSRNPATEARFAQIAQAAASWDGINPIYQELQR